MPQQTLTSVENNFTKGLITEATGLNFPENAATFASNCEFSLIGDVVRRLGINEEVNGTVFQTTRANLAMSTYVWNNPGGDGNSKLLVEQIGGTLYFYNIATSTVASPISNQKLVGTILVSNFAAVGGTFDPTVECEFADGNGYLFVYNKTCEPFYVTYNPGTLALAGATISVQIRDFQGVNDGLAVNTRPASLSNDHLYNLTNQGWVLGSPWTGFSSTGMNLQTLGLFQFTVQTGLTVSPGVAVSITCTSVTGGSPGSFPPSPPFTFAQGTVNSYNSGNGALIINITSNVGWSGTGLSFIITPSSTGMIGTFQTAAGAYPSNSDIWWTFKDSTDTFNPGATVGSVTLSTGQAPQGHFIIGAFNQNKMAVSGLPVTNIVTSLRPSSGAWYAGRVWYTGVNAFQAATGDENFYTWTENIYFSQVVAGVSDFGTCYQTNDPTGDNNALNQLLPTDGGIITIVGCGTIHKLFPVVNGMLVFANNGVWYITGSQGIGFAADDYTVTKISAVKTLSSKSFVDVLGMPYFWNEEGIYMVTTAQNGSLAVEPITVGTILSFYNNIPLASKKYARGAYDPINYVIQWVYKSTQEVSVTDRYDYDSILNFNNYNHAFFPYTVSATTNSNFINGIAYISYPYISTATPEPGFKYPASSMTGGSFFNTFADENDETYVDWGVTPFTSIFQTGFKLHGGAMRKFQVPFLYVYSRNTDTPAAYYIQGIWDYGNITFDSDRWSVPQYTLINDDTDGMIINRHRIRGQGYVLQLQFTSVPNQPFDIMGWGTYGATNMTA